MFPLFQSYSLHTGSFPALTPMPVVGSCEPWMGMWLCECIPTLQKQVPFRHQDSSIVAASLPIHLIL